MDVASPVFLVSLVATAAVFLVSLVLLEVFSKSVFSSLTMLISSLVFPVLGVPLGDPVDPPVLGPSLSRVSSVSLVSLEPVVVVVSASLVVSAVSAAAAFLVVVVSSLVSSTPRVFSSLEVFSNLVVSFLMMLTGSLVSPVPGAPFDDPVNSPVSGASLSRVSFVSLVLASWGPQVHQVTPGSMESGRGRPPA